MAIEQETAGGTGAEISTLKMVIGGETVDAADGQTFEVVNPATGETIATAPLGGKADVDRAVEAAQKAFEDPKGWASWPAGKRGRSLAKLGELVKKNSEELAQLESRNTGKPITSARGEIAGVWLVFDYYAGGANKIYGQTIPVAKPGLDITLKEPIGVCGLIVPWNYPMYMASWKVAPALAAGNTAILKPAQLLPDDGDPDGRAGARGGPPARRPERGDRPGRLGRRGDRSAPGHRQGRVHRRDDDRPGDHAAGLEQREEDQPRARRQERQHRLRRRGPREVRPRVAVLGLRQLRPGLLRPLADPRRALGARAGRRAVRRGDPEGRRRRPVGRQDRGRDPRQLQAARPRPRLHRDRAR